MRLLLIVDNINKAGGIERVISVLSNYFYTNFNYDIEIVSIFTKENKLFFDFNRNIKITHCSKNYEDFQSRDEEKKYFKNLIKDILMDKDVDIIMTFYTHISKAVLLNKKNIRRAKIIITEHVDYYESSIKGRIIKKLMYRKADKLVVLTDEYNRLYSRFLNNVITIPNPISFKTSNQSNLLNKNIISIGRLEKIKKFDQLIDIFKDTSNDYNDWKLTIIGEGLEKENLKKKIRESNLEDRIFLKPFTKDVKSELLESSIYALTSEHEGFELVLLEAQECGLPCISFDITPAKEIISDNINGILVKQGDLKEYSRKLELLMDDYYIRRKFGSKSKLNSSKYSIDIIANKWDKLFKELL